MSPNPSPASAITVVSRDPEREEDRRPLTLALLRRLFSFTRPYRGKRNWLFVLTMLRGAQLVAMAWALATAIHAVCDPANAGDGRVVWMAALGYGGVALLTCFTFHFRQRLALELGESVVHDLRGLLFGHLLRQPMSFFHRWKLGRVLSRVTSDVDLVRQGVQETVFVAIVQLGQGLWAAAVMLWYDQVLFAVVFALVPIVHWLNMRFRASLSRSWRVVQESFSRVTATVAESVNGIRVTQGFARQEINGGLFRALVEDHGRFNMDQARTSALYVPLLEFKTQLWIAILMVLGGWRALNHDVSVDTLLHFFFQANLLFGSMLALGNIYTQALSAMAGAERVFKLIDTEPEWQDAPDARPLPPISGRVVFDRVCFSYEPGRPVLQDLSFVAEAGQTIALVGHTGSGKSSIINLIAKFYQPDSGTLTIDGHDIRAVTGDSLHRQMGIVLQVNFLFTGSVLENIRVGKPDATDAQIIAAARALDCLDLLEALPDGLNTVVGEKGAGISLGQRQLVCFTRAMLADPRILILDEATSSVDGLTEARLQRALAVLLKGRTSFVVAHRLSTIRHADQVLVLDHGRLIERGTHVDLLTQGGIYAGLYRQFITTGAGQ
ncbi:MAG TPA: ABC transporter ATP-binding protein [Planctomycetota bacterium]|nr:ABC transporter ATP-binding protein [Planctomycetota bacterium]